VKAGAVGRVKPNVFMANGRVSRHTMRGRRRWGNGSGFVDSGGMDCGMRSVFVSTLHRVPSTRPLVRGPKSTTV
jgi:hypothetical protein